MKAPLTAALLASTIVVGAGCVPPEESNDRVVRYDPEKTIMGEIQQRGALRVGVTEHCPFSISSSGRPEGFVIDLAERIAESLGVEAEYTAASSVELLGMVDPTDDDPDAETAVDVAFPLVPVTEQLVQRRTVADPYWTGHSRLLVGSDGEVLAEGPDVGLLEEACSTPGAKIDGPSNSTAGYGAVVRTGATAFGNIVSQVTNESDAEGDWTESYERWLAQYFETPESDKVPILSVEDAAALWPARQGTPPTRVVARSDQG